MNGGHADHEIRAGWRHALRLQFVVDCRRVHECLPCLLDNAELHAILKGLIARTTLMIALYDSPGHNACSFDEHDAILDALAAGDSERACSLMNQHLSTAEHKLHRESADGEVDLMALFGAKR